ncbi:MAG: Asp23/Gls24 family envelope stress response protein [Oscillospiraceae bacterium]|nr:Asp23/Gls24 family envelope stress response protein [Oscillospiraceae bacterium]
MSESKDYLVQPVEKGTVNISEEVVAAIAALAVSEVEGVYGLSSSFTADLAELLGRKNMSKGVKLSIEEETVTVECFVVITYGFEIPVVASAIQENVINAIESMTGLKVAAVNVDICGISAPRN